MSEVIEKSQGEIEVTLRGEIDELKERLLEAEKEADEAEERVRELEGRCGHGAQDAINSFLDECECIAPLRFSVPQSDRANRAIVALHDAVGRNT